MYLQERSKDYSLFFGIVIIFILLARPPMGEGVGFREWFGFSIKCSAVLFFAWFLFFEVNKIAGLFVLLALISHYYPQNTLESSLALQGVIVGAGFYTFIILRVSDFKYVLGIICVASIINVIFLAWQHAGVDPYYTLTKNLKLIMKMEHIDNIGIMANRNEASAFIALSFPAFCRKNWFWFIPFLIFGLICAKSFNGVFAMVIGSIFYFWTAAPKSILPITLFLTFSAYLYIKHVHYPTINYRLEPWTQAIAGYKNMPWFGVGLGNWKKLYLTLLKTGNFTQGWIRLHNTYIETTVEMGLFFPVLCFGYAINLIRNFNKQLTMQYMGIITGMVLMCSNSVFKMNAINGLMIIFWLGYAQRGTNISLLLQERPTR